MTLKRVFLLLLVSANLFAGNAQVNNIVQYGGGKNILLPSVILPLASISNMIQLSSQVASSTANNFLMFARWSSAGSAQYQVANGKTFRAFGMYIYASSAPVSLSLGYGTAALGSDNTASAPTGAVYYASASTTVGFVADNTGWTYFPFYMEFPQNSYPFLKTFSSATTYNMILIGTEQ